MRLSQYLALSLFVATSNSAGVKPGQIKNLATFGDSYTDVVVTGDNGVSWPPYAAGQAHVKLFPFARAGATCSNNITFRPFPSIFESQLPLYFQEKQNRTLKLSADDTIYTLWIGTNDVGSNALLTMGNETSLVEVTTCMVNWVKVLYESGARNFIFQNASTSIHNEMPVVDYDADDTTSKRTTVRTGILSQPILVSTKELN